MAKKKSRVRSLSLTSTPSIRISEPNGDRVCCTSTFPKVSGDATSTTRMTGVTAKIDGGAPKAGSCSSFSVGGSFRSSWSVDNVPTVTAGTTTPVANTVTVVGTFDGGATATQSFTFGVICPQMTMSSRKFAASRLFFLHLDEGKMDLEFRMIKNAQILGTKPVRLRLDPKASQLTWRGIGALQSVWTLTALPVTAGKLFAKLEMAVPLDDDEFQLRWLGFPFSSKTGGDLHPETADSKTHFIVSRKSKL